MKGTDPARKKKRASSNGDLDKMRKLLKDLENSLRTAEAFSRTRGFYGCQRTLLHMISHAQTLAESLRSETPGFA
jgi:hypothetical protein